MAVDLTGNCLFQAKLNDYEYNQTVVDEIGGAKANALIGGDSTHSISGTGVKHSNLVRCFQNLDGVNDYINFGNRANVGSGDFSIAAWVYHVEETGWKGILNKRNSTRVDLFRGPSSESYQIYALVYDGSTKVYRRSSISLSHNTWRFVVATFDRDTASYGIDIYIDNVLRNGTWTSDPAAKHLKDVGDLDNTADLIIGKVTANDPWDGRLDNIMIFNKVLTTDDRNFLWNGGDGTEALQEEEGTKIPVFMHHYRSLREA